MRRKLMRTEANGPEVRGCCETDRETSFLEAPQGAGVASGPRTCTFLHAQINVHTCAKPGAEPSSYGQTAHVLLALNDN